MEAKQRQEQEVNESEAMETRRPVHCQDTGPSRRPMEPNAKTRKVGDRGTKGSLKRGAYHAIDFGKLVQILLVNSRSVGVLAASRAGLLGRARFGLESRGRVRHVRALVKVRRTNCCQGATTLEP